MFSTIMSSGLCAGAVVTLFLALAAIQFVVDSDMPASSYVTSLQQLTLVSYLFLVLVGLENIVIWWLTIYHKDKDRWVSTDVN